MKYLALIILAALWAWCAWDKPQTTAEFVKEYCQEAHTDTELEDCTEAYF